MNQPRMDQRSIDQRSAARPGAVTANSAWRNIVHIAADVVREAFARKTIAGIVALLAVAQIALALALDIDVVEGVIVSSRLFGDVLGLGGSAASAGEAMLPIFRSLGLAVFHLGILFGVVATADIAVHALAPGSIELLLSLPVRRLDLVLGTYVGVGLVALACTAFAVGGFSAVLAWKAGIATIAPLAGAIAASIAFGAIYAGMLLATTLVRSSALAAGTGLLLYIISVATSSREDVLQLFERGWVRDVAAVVMAHLPRLRGVADLGARLASSADVDWATSGIALGTTLLFAATALAAAAWVVQRRDW